MYRYYFIPFVIVITLLLALIPVGVFTENLTISKLAGFCTLLITIIALRYWFFALRKNSKRRPIVKLSSNDEYFLKKSYPFIKTWNSNELAILYGRIGVVLSEVRLLQNGKEVDRDKAILFSFIIVFKYLREDIMPLSGSSVSCEELETIIESLKSMNNLAFSDCQVQCDTISL